MAEFCNVLHPVVAAEVLEELDSASIWKVLGHCAIDKQVEIFTYLSLNHQVALVDAVERPRLAELIQHMSSDDRVDLLSQLDTDHVEALMPLIAQAERADIRKLLSYPEESAGALMTTEYAALPEGITAREALDRLRQQAPDRETIYYIYILDDERRLDGLISLRELILARPSAKLADLMERDVVSVRVDDDQEFVAQEMARYDLLALPVVDHDNRLVGIITHDDVLDVMQEEATEDAYRQAAVEPIEEAYLDAEFFTIWRKRAFWLGCLFVGELLTIIAMSEFHDELARLVVLSLFIPLCISTGGNTGSQAGTLIIRAMALGDIEQGDWWRIFRREVLMGLALGSMLGAIGFLVASLTPAGLLDQPGGDPISRWRLAGAIMLSVSAICLWGTVVGSMLPFFLRKLGLDPGYSSGPFVATFVDCTGIMIYFTIAKVTLL